MVLVDAGGAGEASLSIVFLSTLYVNRHVRVAQGVDVCVDVVLTT